MACAPIILLICLLPMIVIAAATPTTSSSPDNALPNFDRMWDYDHPDATEAKFRALLPLAKQSGDMSYLLQLQTQIARCQGLQGKFDDCHATLNGVEKTLADAPPVAQIRYWLERGRAFNSANSPAKAVPLFVAAWEKANAAKEIGHAIDAAHMLAIVETDSKFQVEWNLKAMRLAEQDPRQRRWLPSIFNNLGEAYRASREYEKALDSFQQRAHWLHELGRETDLYTKKDIARMNRMLGRFDAALATIEPIALDLKSKKQPDGYISAEYGQCLAALGRSAEARPYLVEAYEMLSKDDYMVRYEPDELRLIKQLAAIGK